MKAKRIRCTCSNCGSVKYPRARDIDPSEEHFLCPSCDGAYIVWCNSYPGRVYVDEFLASYAAKVARACKS